MTERTMTAATASSEKEPVRWSSAKVRLDFEIEPKPQRSAHANKMPGYFPRVSACKRRQVNAPLARQTEKASAVAECSDSASNHKSDRHASSAKKVGTNVSRFGIRFRSSARPAPSSDHLTATRRKVSSLPMANEQRGAACTAPLNDSGTATDEHPKSHPTFLEYRAWARSEEGRRVLDKYPQPVACTEKQKEEREALFLQYMRDLP